MNDVSDGRLSTLYTFLKGGSDTRTSLAQWHRCLGVPATAYTVRESSGWAVMLRGSISRTTQETLVGNSTLEWGKIIIQTIRITFITHRSHQVRICSPSVPIELLIIVGFYTTYTHTFSNTEVCNVSNSPHIGDCSLLVRVVALEPRIVVSRGGARLFHTRY